MKWLIFLLLTSCVSIQKGETIGQLIQVHRVEVSFFSGEVDTLEYRASKNTEFELYREPEGSTYLKAFNPRIPMKKANFIAKDVYKFKVL